MSEFTQADMDEQFEAKLIAKHSSERAQHGITDPLEAADRAVDRNEAASNADENRPRFHFRPRSGWINDPNGTCYHNGFFHCFYQSNP